MLSSNLPNDLRYTLRQLRRSPGYALTTILTLALAIGTTTAMYSIVRNALLTPLPYPHPAELVGISFSRPGEAPNLVQTGETADYLRRHATSFSSFGIADGSALNQNFSSSNGGADTRSYTVRSLRVSSGYLPALGVRPRLGHTFTSAEDTLGASPTALVSESFWRRALQARANVVGSLIHVNGDPYTVIGVMPSWVGTRDPPDLWFPLHLTSSDNGYEGRNFHLIARLKPAVTLPQASAELTALNEGIYRDFPAYGKRGPVGAPRLRESVWPLQQVTVSEARPSLLAFAAAVLAVLLMACLNLTGLSIARSAGRRSEILVRTALGAARTRVLSLLLLESLVLAVAGSLLGLFLAAVLAPVLLAYSPIDLPQLGKVGLDLRLAAFGIVTGCGTTLFFGLLPALPTFRTSTAPLHRARTAGETALQQRVGKLLIVAQVGLATALLSTSTLFLGTFLKMRSIPSGLRPDHLFALQVNLKGEAYASSAHTRQFISAVEAKLRGIPGVAEVAAVNGLPLDTGLNNLGFPASRPELERSVEVRFTTPGYFKTVGTSLLAGSDFSAADSETSSRVVLINQRAADLWWPGVSPLGEFVTDEGKEPWRIIGVVANAHNQELAGAIEPTIYHAYTQLSDPTIKAINAWFPTTFVLRMADGGATAGSGLAAAAAAATVAVDPVVPASKFAPMQTFIDRTVAAPRFFSWLAGGFAVFALLLTLIGLFGLLSYQVASRTREIGVRMALGARRSQVLNFILSKGLVLTLVGLLLGAGCSLLLRTLLAHFIASTARVDPASLGPVLESPATSLATAGLAMLVSAVAASLIPARRAATIEPTEALRAD